MGRYKAVFGERATVFDHYKWQAFLLKHFAENLIALLTAEVTSEQRGDGDEEVRKDKSRVRRIKERKGGRLRRYGVDALVVRFAPFLDPRLALLPTFQRQCRFQCTGRLESLECVQAAVTAHRTRPKSLDS
jgi:hypothetical protein